MHGTILIGRNLRMCITDINLEDFRKFGGQLRMRGKLRKSPVRKIQNFFKV